MTWALAVVAGGVGALARYLVGGAVQHRVDSTAAWGTGPVWGTSIVNLTGAVLLGLVVGLHGAGRVTDGIVLVVGAGFCGGFTTFSTWMVESVEFARPGGSRVMLALARNLTVLLVGGVVGAAVGTWIG